jgi:signal transduction histidine kinase
MFQEARLKLTAWYLLIIMLVSTAFSLVIYVGISRELERGFRRAELRLRAKEFDITLPLHFSDLPEDLPPRLREATPRFILIEDLEAAKKRLVWHLLAVNGFIMGVSAMAGYFLAGKTLQPIEEALEEQKRFVADASHELRTPLTALRTSLEVALRDKKLSLSSAKEVIKSNLEDVDGLQGLAHKLLALANLQSNGQSLGFQKIDMAGLAKEAYRKILPLAAAKKIELKTKLAKQTVLGDKESLEEMLLIFLDNAVKYTPKGGKIRLATKTQDKNLVITIKDTGIGIAKKDLPHIFNRFYRADQSRSKQKADGFGLGLSLAKKIIELHHGSVTVASRPGKGTTFTVKLPLKQT